MCELHRWKCIGCQLVWTTHKKVETCADCTLKYLAGFLGAPYDSNKIDEEEFTSLASSCGAKPTDFPHPTTTLPLPPPTGTPGPNITCRGGTDYKVKSGDSCESIAQANSMAIDKLLYLNGLDFKCETLTVGSSLCIKDSCKLYKVEPGKTCKQIISDNGFTMVELVHWNPILETACDNMTMMAGRTICITPPGTNEYDGGMTATPNPGNPMNTTTGWVPAIPTTTLTTRDGGPAPTKYFENCPLDEGADAWEFMSEECKELLDPYCDPVLTGDPLPPTTFPSSCTDVYWGAEGATAEGARVAETSSALPNGTYSRRL
ncbi:hypothetical protein NUW58_g9268 [Xylaria curta]|uniref:Uncharacterized protein n=1 Tax=Xylaria curta TaxID=42375 RepID=A0ACC1MYY2_9PEZI|nr:hypothetical protein NUW58_g9268 [Xylaria curta]